MLRTTAEEYRPEFDAFMACEIVESYEPILLGSLDEGNVSALLGRRLRDSYQHRSWVAQSLEGQLIKVDVMPDIEGYTEATNEFCRVVGSERQVVEKRFGRFHKLNKWARQSRPNGVDVPHLDVTRKKDGTVNPVFASVLVVGAETIVHVGRIKRNTAAIAGSAVTFLDGETVRLKSGSIYRLSPLTAHIEPPEPWIPENRFFWRRHHDSVDLTD